MSATSNLDADSLGVVFRSLRVFHRRGLTMAYALVFSAVASADGGEITYAELFERCGLRQSHLSKIITALEDLKLVKSITPSEDRRMTTLRITKHGTSLFGTKTEE